MPHYPVKSMGIQHQRGFSLVESLFSALILGIALLGLAGFHAVALQDGGLVKARSLAASLAQEKLDDLRSFSTLDEFDAIAEDEGGMLSSGPVSGYGYLDSYSRTWTVSCSTETAGSALSFGSTCTDAVAKLATVIVSWTDSKGGEQEVKLEGVIYAMDPARLALATGSAFSSQKPKAGYTPIGVPDAVPVPINTGTGEYKESSKPVPEVVSSDTGAEVSFDAVSYVSKSGGGYDTTAKEEFVTTSCECEFNGTGEAYAPSRMIWTGTRLKAKIGDQISKTVGQVASSGQSDLCNACCKDHHDVAGTSQPKYDPDRPDSEYGDGDHKHYWYAGCVSGTHGATGGCSSGDKNPAAGYGVVSTGAYLESCRFRRVDGFWRLWQDWRQVKMTVIPYNYLTNPDNLDKYVGAIEAVVENTIRTDSGNGSKIIPELSGRDVTFGAVGDLQQLLGRAVYVDRIYQEADPSALDEVYYDKLVALIGAEGDWLNIVPFYEANLTLLIDWSSSNASTTVTSEAIDDIFDVADGYYKSYSRGKVKAISAGAATITATARLHNTGVTGGINTSSPSYGISGYDNTGPLSDSISVTVPGTAGTAGISGKFIRSNESVVFSTLQIAGYTCTLLTAIGNELPYKCIVTSGDNVTLSYSSTASGYSFSPASEAFGVVTVAKEAGNVTVYGPTVLISGSIEPTVSSKAGAKLTSVTATGGTCNIAAGGKTYSCTVSRGTSGYSGTITFVGDAPSPATKDYAGQQADAVLNVTITK